MKKVLAIFMAIAMFVTMFSLSVVSFAEGETEKEVLNKYLGTATVANFGLKYDRRQGVIADETHGNLAKPWNLHVFNPATEITEGKIAAVQPTIGTSIIDKVNEYAASGDYSAIVINFTADSGNAVLFTGLKGTEETPIILQTKDDEITNKLFTSAREDAAISLIDCENVTIKNIAVTSLSNGILVEGCSNVAIEGVEFSKVGFTDYNMPIAVLDDNGDPVLNEDGTIQETTAKMDTTALSEKGSAVFVGANCDGVTVTSCKFTDCRAGVVADSANLEEGDVASAGISVIDCTFTGMTDAAVYVDSTDDVVVAGGSVTKSGILANASDYDGVASVANFYANNAKNITIERIYSTDNSAFIEAWDATGRVRYNVSDRDGSSFVAADELLIYNNTFVASATLNLSAVVKNNIFDMNMGDKVLDIVEGEANCYHWTNKGDKNSIKKNPWFANAYDGSVEGTSVVDNYILASGSPCIGAGVKVEDDMGTTDFYGNEIDESYNIGAYAGEGAEATVELVSQFADVFNYIFALIKNFFANLFA